jgi:arylsulfatase A-like enzyme
MVHMGDGIPNPPESVAKKGSSKLLEAPVRYTAPYTNASDIGRRTFIGMVALADEAVGNATTAWESAGLLENGLVILSSDNGSPPDFRGEVSRPLLARFSGLDSLPCFESLERNDTAGWELTAQGLQASAVGGRIEGAVFYLRGWSSERWAPAPCCGRSYRLAPDSGHARGELLPPLLTPYCIFT